MTKFIPELGRELSGRALDIYEGRSGLSEEKRQAYIATWKGEKPAPRSASAAKTDERCVHRSIEPVRLVKCVGCGGNVHTKVYGCSVHGECTVGKRLDGVRGLCRCKSYRSAETLLTLGAPPAAAGPRVALSPFADAVAWVSNARLAIDTAAFAGLIPRDCSGIVGVPRSGMLPASMLATQLHIPLGEIDGHGKIRWLASGSRGGGGLASQAGPVVIIDDTVYAGSAMRRARLQVGKINALFAAIYVRPEVTSAVDLYARALPAPHLLEWNFANNGPMCGFASDSSFGNGIASDLDGIICHDEHSGGPVGTPYLTPRLHPVKLIITGRNEKYRAATENDLNRWRVKWGRIVMLPNDVVCNTENAAAHKAKHYAAAGQGYFIESCPEQAQIIHRMTGKRVICPRADKVWV